MDGLNEREGCEMPSLQPPQRRDPFTPDAQERLHTHLDFYDRCVKLSWCAFSLLASKVVPELVSLILHIVCRLSTLRASTASGSADAQTPRTQYLREASMSHQVCAFAESCSW